ncbi:hypothetical protein TNCV_2297421 [Trichonephila clavipes]|nr:hypothetical protein TNCV_2297421 [Trichonephila clavipes]
MQLLPWPAYSPDMSPIEHVWNLVGWRLARDSSPAASNDELLLRIQQYFLSKPLRTCHIERLMRVKSVEAQSPPLPGVDVPREGASYVSSSLLHLGSKLRGLSPIPLELL